MSFIHRLLSIKLLDLVLAVALAVLVVIVFGNVTLRLFWQTGFVATEEVSRILLVWLVLIGAVAALHDYGHLGVNMLALRLRGRWKTSCAVLVCMLMLVCDALLLAGAYRQYVLSEFDSYPVTGWPLSIIYLPGIVAAALFILITGFRLLHLLLGKLDADEFFQAGQSDPESAVKQGATE